MESFGEPGSDGLVDCLIRWRGVLRMVFGNSQRWVFHKIASCKMYVCKEKNMKSRRVKRPLSIQI